MRNDKDIIVGIDGEDWTRSSAGIALLCGTDLLLQKSATVSARPVQRSRAAAERNPARISKHRTLHLSGTNVDRMCCWPACRSTESLGRLR